MSATEDDDDLSDIVALGALSKAVSDGADDPSLHPLVERAQEIAADRLRGESS